LTAVQINVIEFDNKYCDDFAWLHGSWCVYAAATVDRCLSTINEQLERDAAEQDSKKLEAAFAAADSFARRLEKQLNKRNFICGSTLVYLTTQLTVKTYF